MPDLNNKQKFSDRMWMGTAIVAVIIILLLLIKTLFNTLLLVLAAALVAIFFHGCAGLLHRKSR